MGSKGAFLHNSTNQKLISSPIVKAIDTTAAGDVFNGAFSVALSKDFILEKAIEFACKAASISVTRMGAQASAPMLEEIL